MRRFGVGDRVHCSGSAFQSTGTVVLVTYRRQPVYLVTVDDPPSGVVGSQMWFAEYEIGPIKPLDASEGQA